MSKYGALWKHIAAQGEDNLELSFSQVGEMAGIPLDHTLSFDSRRYEPASSNNTRF